MKRTNICSIACATALLAASWTSGACKKDETSLSVDASEQSAQAGPLMSIVKEQTPETEMQRASSAFERGDYEETCGHLVASGFSQPVCDWITKTIAGDKSASLPSTTLEKFLRSQHVRNLSGRIVSFYDQARNEYEVRVGGRLAILAATETSYSTTGAFRMWAQAQEKSEEELASGRTVQVQVYREWPLFKAIRNVITERPADKPEAAKDLLEEIVRGWEDDYCYQTDPLSLDGCDVAEVAVASNKPEQDGIEQ